MSDSQVIARKFRPQAFGQVVGQEAITRTLANALTTGRIHHAYLFTGARGVGKTTTARILAKCLNCVKGVTTEPCGVCASCRDITASRSMDVLEIDAASNTGVDNVRDVIINSVSNSAPPRDRYKIFIIDEVHMLSNAAFNALLKTLEEPPPRIVFIMATTELQKVPETILSRCQVFEFRTITLRKIFDQLRHIADAEGVEVGDAALLAVARAGDGSMRDAESALDQVISFAGKKINDEDVSAALGLVDVETLNETMRAIADQDSARILRAVDAVVSRGYDIRNFCRELMVHTRGLLVIKVAGFDAELVQMAQSEGERLSKLADAFSEQDLMRFFAILTKTEQDIRTSSQPRFQLEMGLIKLAHARRLYLLEEALGQIAELQSKLGVTGATASGGAGPAVSTPPPAKSGGATLGASKPRPATRAADRPEAEPPRFASRPQAVPADKPPTQPNPQARPSEVDAAGGREALPNPFARESKPSPAAPITAPRHAEPPESPSYDEPYEVERDLPPPAKGPAGLEGKDAVDAIKREIESRRKMMLLSALDHAQSIEVDGDFLRITFAPDSAVLKNQLESKDNRKVIEEVCREVVGRRMTLSASVGAQPKEQAAPQKRAATQKKKAQDDPRISALAEKFRGEVIEVKSSDS